MLILLGPRRLAGPQMNWSGIKHIMASSALPPGFPPVEIDGEYDWDGGLFSNTPLEYVLDYSQRRNRLTFQVDLFNVPGPIAD